MWKEIDNKDKIWKESDLSLTIVADSNYSSQLIREYKKLLNGSIMSFYSLTSKSKDFSKISISITVPSSTDTLTYPKNKLLKNLSEEETVWFEPPSGELTVDSFIYQLASYQQRSQIVNLPYSKIGEITIRNKTMPELFDMEPFFESTVLEALLGECVPVSSTNKFKDLDPYENVKLQACTSPLIVYYISLLRECLLAQSIPALIINKFDIVSNKKMNEFDILSLMQKMYLAMTEYINSEHLPLHSMNMNIPQSPSVVMGLKFLIPGSNESMITRKSLEIVNTCEQAFGQA